VEFVDRCGPARTHEAPAFPATRAPPCWGSGSKHGFVCAMFRNAPYLSGGICCCVLTPPGLRCGSCRQHPICGYGHRKHARWPTRLRVFHPEDPRRFRFSQGTDACDHRCDTSNPRDPSVPLERIPPSPGQELGSRAIHVFLPRKGRFLCLKFSYFERHIVNVRTFVQHSGCRTNGLYNRGRISACKCHCFFERFALGKHGHKA
jgi:hypothetical protein